MYFGSNIHESKYHAHRSVNRSTFAMYHASIYLGHKIRLSKYRYFGNNIHVLKNILATRSIYENTLGTRSVYQNTETARSNIKKPWPQIHASITLATIHVSKYLGQWPQGSMYQNTLIARYENTRSFHQIPWQQSMHPDPSGTLATKSLYINILAAISMYQITKTTGSM